MSEIATASQGADQAATTPDRVNRRAIILAELQRAQMTATNTADIGRSTLTVLEQQQQSLRSTEDTLESNEYILNRSAFTLRGMSWIGWLQNKLTSTEEPVPEHSGFSQPPQHSRNQQLENNETIFRDCGNDDDEEGKHLDAIAQRVEELKLMSLSIGGEIANQSTTLGRIDDKTDRVRDKTLQVTLKAAQFTARSKRSREKFVGRFQLVDSVSGFCLAAVGEDLVLLQDHTNRATFFDAFEKEDNLIGLRNAKTHKFVGVTYYGAVRVAGNYFGKQEELYMSNLGKAGAGSGNEDSGLLFLSKNWSKGGWLRADSDQGLRISGEVLTEVTTCVSDKLGRLLFRAVHIEIKEPPEEK